MNTYVITPSRTQGPGWLSRTHSRPDNVIKREYLCALKNQRQVCTTVAKSNGQDDAPYHKARSVILSG